MRRRIWLGSQHTINDPTMRPEEDESQTREEEEREINAKKYGNAGEQISMEHYKLEENGVLRLGASLQSVLTTSTMAQHMKATQINTIM
ncbi:hypothetical protein EYF80_035109 [Liparis tanakae]|uniref:Uncharacterized protein n=1 Tax=Liparis tanakae TaxID=230148 RepID=A0A4Z2GMG4_9TELE|nr:hypothetical protein EYF80_035109 [Liparis tanakae]